MELPQKPTFEQRTLDDCRASRDPTPLLMACYTYVSQSAHFAARISTESAAYRRLTNSHAAALRGQLQRCARLMQAVVHLGQGGSFGETIAILSRCITESAIKIIWLCKTGGEEPFNRYLADGLQNDLLLKALILQNIAERGGVEQVIEARMLRSINATVAASALSEEQIPKIKRLPKMHVLLRDVGQPDDSYLAIQRMGSHPIHGTWYDLLQFYLDEGPEGEFAPRQEPNAPHPNFFLLPSLVVADAIRAFYSFAVTDEDMAYAMDAHFYDIMIEIQSFGELGREDDRRPSPPSDESR